MSSKAPTPPPAEGTAASRAFSTVGVVALLLALIGLAIAFIAPAALFAWFFTLPAFIVAIVGLTRKSRRRNLAVAGLVMSIFAFLTSIVSFSVYSAGVSTQRADSQSSISSTHATVTRPAPDKPSPTPTPTPPPPVPDVSAQAPASAQAALTANGYVVVVVDSSGASVADPTGYTYVSESPTAGTPLAPGSTVTLTVAAPPPPPPVVVAPAPAPAPAAGGGASALCRDGTLSYSAHRSGTCSHHGGVAQWY